MILNEQGNVIWEKFLPEELPRTYSNLQIAKFSRWYLQEYPVFIQEHSAGLLVIGCEPNSITKYNFSIDINYIHSLIVGIFLMICFNILLIFILFWRNTHKIEKSIVPIIDGIDSIAQGKPLTLSETGELSSINAELNKAGKHLLQKEQARAEWINGVSHDVRTPLSIILGYASEIEKNEDASQPVQLQASIIRKQSEKLRSLIADLNLTSRLEYSMQPLIKTSFSPVEIARQVIIGFMNGPIDNKYSFDFHSSSDTIPVLIKGDTELFSRMLSNLIQNCINHNPHGCEITVEILKENEIPATFFLQGQCLAGNEEIVRRMHAEGHLIGNHTFHHVQLTKVSEEEAREEVVKTSNAIYEITGEYPVYIRPPFGEWREGLDLAVTMIPVLWDVDSRDWESQNTASICSAVLPNVKDGSIILMHDGYRATVEALRRIVKELKEEGYTFVTVRELIEE